VQGARIIAGSVLLGSVVIALGLYFGLRASSTAAPYAGPAHAAPGSAAPALPRGEALPRPAESGPAERGPPAPGTSVSADAAAALAAMHGELKKKCWEPAIAAQPAPARSKYLVSLSFDKDGREVGRGISEIRDADSRPDVATCLRGVVAPLKISPPQQFVTVEIPLAFP
jgi:hypothetical protein